MAHTGGKVIEAVKRRRQIEADILSLLEVTTELELEERAGRIAVGGREVIPVILKNLNTQNRRMLGALGKIATHLDVREISPALRDVARNHFRPDGERLAAILILERFLHEELGDELFEGLKDPKQVAIQYFLDILDEAETSRFALMEYIQALDEQPVDVVLFMLEAMQQARGVQMVEPLRVMALDHRQDIAQEAVHALGRIRTSESARVLQGIIQSSDAPIRRWAERSLRKLRMCGVPVLPLPSVDLGWRCLVSPVDGDGLQSVWFINNNGSFPRPMCRFLHVLLSDRRGIIDAIGDDKAEEAYFPARRPKGRLHVFALSDSPSDAIVMETDLITVDSWFVGLTTSAMPCINHCPLCIGCSAIFFGPMISLTLRRRVTCPSSIEVQRTNCSPTQVAY